MKEKLEMERKTEKHRSLSNDIEPGERRSIKASTKMRNKGGLCTIENGERFPTFMENE